MGSGLRSSRLVEPIGLTGATRVLAVVSTVSDRVPPCVILLESFHPGLLGDFFFLKGTYSHFKMEFSFDIIIQCIEI